MYILQTGHDAFSSPKKYLAEMLVKPLLFVLMAWLAGCAVANSKKPERWLLLVAVGPVLPAASMLIYLPMMGYNLQFLASPQARYIYANVGLHTTQYGLLFASAFAIRALPFEVMEKLAKTWACAMYGDRGDGASASFSNSWLSGRRDCGWLLPVFPTET